MKQSFAVSEAATSPLDFNLEAVLPGVHSRLSSMQAQIGSGFGEMRTWKGEVNDTMSDNAQKLVKIAASLLQGARGGSTAMGTGMGGATTMGTGTSGGATTMGSSPQQQAAATDEDDDNDNFEKAKMHQMAPRYMSLETIYYEWYGLECFKDKPIVGGFERCEQVFKHKWRKDHSWGQKKHFSRLKRIIEGIQKKAAMEGIDIMAAVTTLAPIYQGDCKKSISKMEDWMSERGFIQKGKSRATPT
jgi:hypothetical protein